MKPRCFPPIAINQHKNQNFGPEISNETRLGVCGCEKNKFSVTQNETRHKMKFSVFRHFPEPSCINIIDVNYTLTETEISSKKFLEIKVKIQIFKCPSRLLVSSVT